VTATRTRTRFLVAALAAFGSAGPAPARGESLEVVVVKRAGVTAFEEVAEEFGERCRVRVRVVSFGDEGTSPDRARIENGDVVVTVGQEALDAMRGVNAHIIPTLAFHTPPGLVGPPSAPPPELVLRVLTVARPAIRTVGAVYGPRSQNAALAMADAARRLGLALISRPVSTGPEAVRALHAFVDHVQAIWLPGDTDVVTPQVFQYALGVQLERGMPLAAATRQQVHSGALVAVDFSPRAAGRAAAELANRFLDGKSVTAREELELYGGARISINSLVARRLGVDRDALERMGARFE
jgi:hypothetical protein